MNRLRLKPESNTDRRFVSMLAHISAWFSLMAGLLVIYLSFALFDFLPPAASGMRNMIYLLNFAGTILGAVLCPLFLPLPRQMNGSGPPLLVRKPAVQCLCILLYILPNLIIRSLGAGFWLGSVPARVILGLNSGMFYPVGFGLYYLTWGREGEEEGKRRGLCSFGFALALMIGLLAGLGAKALIGYWGLASDPARAVAVMFGSLRWAAAALGLSASVCVIFVQAGRRAEAAPSGPRQKTGWEMIGRLLVLAAVLCLLNSLLGTRLFPQVSGVSGAMEPFYPVMVPAVPALALLADRLTLRRSFRFFLLPLMILFILLPLLHIGYPLLTRVMSTLVGISVFLIWAVFTTAVVEQYHGNGGFYLCASAAYLSFSFSLIGISLAPYIPQDTSFTVLVSVIGAAVFAFLGFRLLFPGLPLLEESTPAALVTVNGTDDGPAGAAIFKAHGLTGREQEIARLMLDGLDNKSIAGRILLAESTVAFHITNIYRKFGIKGKKYNRAEFVAKVLK